MASQANKKDVKKIIPKAQKENIKSVVSKQIVSTPKKIEAPTKIVEATSKIFPDHLKNEAEECPICTEIMVEPCRLPCKHYFCIQCIKWAF